MANNEMNHTLLKKFILTEIRSTEEQDFSMMIEGPHGIGKSAIISEVCLEEDGFLIDLRLGQRDLGDILGMPAIIDVENAALSSTKEVVVDKRFQHIKPDLIRNAFVKDLKELGLMGDENDVLSKYRNPKKVGKPYSFISFFADEYNRGTKDVQQAMFELVYDRRMSGSKVNPRCFIFAACNDNMEIYTVTEGDPAFRSRFKTIKYSPTVEEWLKWGRQSGELCEELIFVISAQKQLADPPKKNNDIDFLNQPHPNRRSWHHASKFYVRNRDKFSEAEMRDCMAAFVGGEAAEIFRQMMQKMTKTVKTREASTSVEAAKPRDFFNNYIQHMKWNKETAKTELSKFNASELTALETELTKQFNTYKYVTQSTKDRILEMAEEVMPKEVFARIWVNVLPSAPIKKKLLEYVAKKNPHYFDQYEKLANKP